MFTIKNLIKKINNLTIKYMTIINFDNIIGKEHKTNNKYCLNHPTNTLIVDKTNIGRTNILFNLIA